MSEEHDQALKSLLRIKGFDPNELVQNKKLGENDFKNAVEPAKRVISLYQRIPDSIVSDLSKGSARALKRSADVTFSRFEEILQFEAISRFVWVDWFPVMRGTHQMLWCRVRLAGG